MKRIFKEGSIATCWTGTSIAFQIWGQNGNFIIVLLGIFFRKKFGSKCKFLGVKMQRNLKLGGENKNSRESMGENINLKSLKVDHLKLPTWQFIQLSSFSLSSPSISLSPSLSLSSPTLLHQDVSLCTIHLPSFKVKTSILKFIKLYKSPNILIIWIFIFFFF